jgi:hypothetical protein
MPTSPLPPSTLGLRDQIIQQIPGQARKDILSKVWAHRVPFR